MQPWKVSVGLTVTVAGLATILTHRAGLNTSRSSAA